MFPFPLPHNLGWSMYEGKRESERARERESCLSLTLRRRMQSVFGFHDPRRVRAVCYATTPSDKSCYRQKIEREAPLFHDASGWSPDRLAGQIVQDQIHILVNLNGYTRGARNEIFAAVYSLVSKTSRVFVDLRLKCLNNAADCVHERIANHVTRTRRHRSR